MPLTLGRPRADQSVWMHITRTSRLFALSSEAKNHIEGTQDVPGLPKHSTAGAKSGQSRAHDSRGQIEGHSQTAFSENTQGLGDIPWNDRMVKRLCRTGRG